MRLKICRKEIHKYRHKIKCVLTFKEQKISKKRHHQIKENCQYFYQKICNNTDIQTDYSIKMDTTYHPGKPSREKHLIFWKMVEPRGIEPLTSSLPAKRSPS